MNIRHYLPKFVAITAVAFLTVASSCFGAVLSVPQYNQEQDQWCWNASSQMILAFKGYSYTQTAIADWAVAGQNVPNYLFNSPDSRKDCKQVLEHFGSLSSSGSSSYISLSALDTEMANSRPVMIGVSWDSGGGHAIVLRGTSGSSVYVNDPWPSNGQSVQTYDGVRRYLGSGTWSQTLQLTGGSSPTTYYEYCLYYYNLYQQAYAQYQSSGSYYYLAYSYAYYAYTYYYYWMYNNNSSNASAYYNYYMQYAQYYYNLYQTQAYYAYYYSLYYSYYSAYYSYYQRTGQNVYLAYAYYYYAYTAYCYYMYHGNSNSANAYYNYYMYWANYYYARRVSGVEDVEIPAA